MTNDDAWVLTGFDAVDAPDGPDLPRWAPEPSLEGGVDERSQRDRSGSGQARVPGPRGGCVGAGPDPQAATAHTGAGVLWPAAAVRGGNGGVLERSLLTLLVIRRGRVMRL